jgi:hypothetical protein
MKKKIINGIVFFIAGVIVALISIQGCEREIEPKVEYVYKTDTLAIYKPFMVHDTLRLIAPPRFVRIYIDTTPSNSVVECDKEIITLHDTISGYKDTLAHDFLTKFTRSQKLIELKLSRDSMDITLMDMQARVKTLTYPMDFNHYKYQFLSDSLRYEELPKPKLSKTLLSNSGIYAGVGYEFLSKTPLVNLDYQIQMNRLQGMIQIASTLQTTPNLTLTAGVNYKISK